jgi:hypothetical protein
MLRTQLNAATAVLTGWLHWDSDFLDLVEEAHRALCGSTMDPLKLAITCLFVKLVQGSVDRLLADRLIRIHITIYLLRQHLQRHCRIPFFFIKQLADHRHS